MICIPLMRWTSLIDTSTTRRRVMSLRWRHIVILYKIIKTRTTSWRRWIHTWYRGKIPIPVLYRKLPRSTTTRSRWILTRLWWRQMIEIILEYWVLMPSTTTRTTNRWRRILSSRLRNIKLLWHHLITSTQRKRWRNIVVLVMERRRSKWWCPNSRRRRHCVAWLKSGGGWRTGGPVLELLNPVLDLGAEVLEKRFPFLHLLLV